MNIYGDWFVELKVEVKGENSLGEEYCPSETIMIPLNRNSETTKEHILTLTDSLMELLSRKIISAYSTNLSIQDDDEVTITSKRLVLLCYKNQVKISL